MFTSGDFGDLDRFLDLVKVFLIFFILAFTCFAGIGIATIVWPDAPVAAKKVCHCHCDKCDCGDKCNHIILKPDRRGFVGATR